ncbi:MAG: hypothetical protein ABSG56_32685 [Bryobacteraceae bacterium]
MSHDSPAAVHPLQNGGEVEIGGRAGQRVFGAPELVAAGFEAAEAKR